MLICVSCNKYKNKEIIILIQPKKYILLLVSGCLPRQIQDFSNHISVFVIYISHGGQFE